MRIDIGDLGIDRSYVENFLWGKCCVDHFNRVFCNLGDNVGLVAGGMVWKTQVDISS